MPREAVHWNVLSRALKQLDRTPFSRLFPAGTDPQSQAEAKKILAAMYLGAMAHDAPYYYKFGGAKFEAAAEILHGSDGNDTFDPFRRIAAEILRRPAAEQPVIWLGGDQTTELYVFPGATPATATAAR